MRLTEFYQSCPHCGGPAFSDLILAEKKDACYHKVKASAKVWPSAYASGRLVQCRKKGAANYGNKSESVSETNVAKYKDLGATNQTTHFIKNVTTGKIVSPHRSLQDAQDALVGSERVGSERGSSDKFKIVRARKGVTEAADNTAFRQGYEQGIRYYRRGPQNPYEPGTPEFTDYNDGYQMGEADSYDKYDTSSMDENSR